MGKPPHLVDLKQDAPPFVLTETGSSTDVLGCFGTNILCQWDGANRIIVRELHGTKFTQRGVIAVESGKRPSRVAYNVCRQSLAWAEGTTSNSVFVASLAAPGRRIELESDVPGLVPVGFSEDGKYLVAVTRPGIPCAWFRPGMPCAPGMSKPARSWRPSTRR